jgi:HD-GYP domain-containing protein (c-di-GMP phosphodiesterase class II)/DNA-binding CsgD family transcriptional regulator
MTMHTRLRLSDLLAALSLATDLAMGKAPEEAIRACLVATGLARRAGLRDEQVADVYWTALLTHVGCTAIAHDQAALFGGDEITVNAIGASTDFEDPRQALAFMLELGRSRSRVRRALIVLAGLTRGRSFGRDAATATCEVAAGLAPRLGLSAGVARALNESFERWDGRGAPRGLGGEEIALPARVAHVAMDARAFHQLGGSESALEICRQRAGRALDPAIVDVFCGCAAELLAEVDGCDAWQAVAEAEPMPHRLISELGVDEVARAFADAIDLKSPWLVGHSRGVARLAEEAGRELGLDAAQLMALRRAALFHDLGRLAVPNAVWEKPGPLSVGEWEQVRLHAYHTERVLARSPLLVDIATLAGMHHERLDGSGYHRGAATGAIPLPARVLAAADAYQAMTEARPHRAALLPAAAADRLHDEARAGRLDARAVEAVLAAAGQDRGAVPRQGWPAGLTDREVDVLRLLARGLRNRGIASTLHISASTVGTHIEHIYQKLGVSSRAAATMFAAANDLLD